MLAKHLTATTVTGKSYFIGHFHNFGDLRKRRNTAPLFIHQNEEAKTVLEYLPCVIPRKTNTTLRSLCNLFSYSDSPSSPECGQVLPSPWTQTEETGPAGTQPTGAQPELPEQLQQPEQLFRRLHHPRDGEDGEGERQTGFRDRKHHTGKSGRNQWRDN